MFPFDDVIFIVFLISQGGWMVGAPGAGGQMGYFDADAKLGWGYLRNHLSVYTIGDEPSYLELEQAMYETLRRLEKKLWRWRLSSNF